MPPPRLACPFALYHLKTPALSTSAKFPSANLKQSGERAAQANAMTNAALSSFIFYLGISSPSWLNFLDVPAFINRRRFERLKRKFPRARTRWALDSGGFTEIEMYGEWRMTAREYVAFVRFLRDVVGNLAFAIARDWPVTLITNRRTGLGVKAHQARTLVSYV